MKLPTCRFLLVGAVLSAATLMFAATLEKQGKDWLDQYKDPAQINVTGTWNSTFGNLELNQAKDSRDVSGTAKGYDLTGVVSGRTLYLLFVTHHGTVDYCAEVTSSTDTLLTGDYQVRVSRLRMGAGSAVCQTKSITLRLTKR